MNKNHIIETQALAQYEELLGEESADFIRDIINTFLEDSIIRIDELSESLNTGDSQTFHRAAHTLKSGCATVGAENLSHEFLQLEKQSADGNLSDVSALYEQCILDLNVIRKILLEKLEVQS